MVSGKELGRESHDSVQKMILALLAVILAILLLFYAEEDRTMSQKIWMKICFEANRDLGGAFALLL